MSRTAARERDMQESLQDVSCVPGSLSFKVPHEGFPFQSMPICIINSIYLLCYEGFPTQLGLLGLGSAGARILSLSFPSATTPLPSANKLGTAPL